MRIETTKSLLRSLRRRTDDELKSAANAMQSAAATFGRPHLHTGIDTRRLGKNHFECRVSLDLRLVFKSANAMRWCSFWQAIIMRCGHT
jgi:hypothetical protein